MPVTIRISENCEADRLASARLSDEGFGHPAPSSAAEIGPLTTGAQTTYLAERDGDIVGKARDRHYESWFGGRTVTTAGVASVTVAAEERGGGTMRLLMSALMEGARERGAAISTLVPTAPGAYRRFGYESITTYEYLRVPTSQFTRITPGAGTTRRGYRTGPPATVDFAVSGASVTGVDGAYELVVAEGRGRCRRIEHTTGPTFTPGGLALLYAGAQSCHNIAFAGGVSGGGEQYDRLDALFGGRQVHIRDSF